MEPDKDMRPEFDRILALLETGIDPGPPSTNFQPGIAPPSSPTGGAPEQSASSCAPVKEVTARWWELSKSFAVIASLAGKQDVARTYASQALALLDTVSEKAKPDKAVIVAIQALASKATPSKPVPLTNEPNRTAVIFLTTTPLGVITSNTQETNDEKDEIRTTTKGTIEVFEVKRPVTGPVSALEAVQLLGLPSKARLVLNLPLEILNSPALPKLISEGLDPSETIIYTRVDAKAAESLRQKYPHAKVHREGNIAPEAIRETEMKTANYLPEGEEVMGREVLALVSPDTSLEDTFRRFRNVTRAIVRPLSQIHRSTFFMTGCQKKPVSNPKSMGLYQSPSCNLDSITPNVITDTNSGWTKSQTSKSMPGNGPLTSSCFILLIFTRRSSIILLKYPPAIPINIAIRRRSLLN